MAGIGGWVTSLLGNGSPAGTVTATSPRKGTVINDLRNNAILLGSVRHVYPMDRSFRGLELFPAVADTYEDHPEYLDSFVVDWDKLRGDDSGLDWNVLAIVDVRAAGATAGRVQIVLAGTSTLVVEGASFTNTTWAAPQTLTIPQSTGVKTYRPQVKRADLLNGIHVVSYGLVYAPEPVA